MSALFTHTPIAPDVPAEQEYAYQRYFTGVSHAQQVFRRRSVMALSKSINDTSREAACRVYRRASDDVAEVSLSVDHGHHSAQIQCHFSPAELRDIAQRLLDAAHDIETNPAALLEAQADQTEAVPK